MLRKISVVALMFCGSLLLSNVSFAQDTLSKSLSLQSKSLSLLPAVQG